MDKKLKPIFAIVVLIVLLMAATYVAPTMSVDNRTLSTKSPVATAHTTYEAQFITSGLPSGTQWGIYWNNAGIATLTTTGYINETGLTAGSSYPWKAASVSGYSVSPISGTISIPTIGGNIQQTLTYTAKPPQTYTMYFNETGLSGGTTWKITVAGTLYSANTASISVTEPNGTYAFNVSHIAGYFAPSPQYGNVTVNGANVATTITFDVAEYTVTFTETGLPSGTTWYVNITNENSMSSTTSTISRLLPNGTYDFSIATANKLYEPESYNPSFTVDAQTVSISVQFAKTLYDVTFSEAGLPSGTQWQVTLNGTRMSSTLSSMTFSVSNATYPFSVLNLTSFLPTPYKGSVTVNGAGVNVKITFKTNLTITFVETGLPTGKAWSVTFNGTAKTSSTNTIGFYTSLIGVYSFTVGSLSYWSISPSSGTINVTQNVSVAIDFNRIFNLTIVESGALPSGTSWSIQYNGQIYTSTTNTIVLTVSTGTASFIVLGVNGYYDNPSAWSNFVTKNQTVNILFTVAPANPGLIFNSWDAFIVLLVIGLPLLGYIVIRVQRGR